jgi:hypothetical protein
MFQQEPARWMDTFYYTAEYPYDSPAWYTYIFDLTNGYYSDLLSAVSNGQMVTFMLSAPEDSNVAFNFCAYVQQWPDVTNLRPEGPILTVFTEEDPCGTSLISNCYTNVSVCGQNYVGGLIGRNSASVKACYSSGSVSGDISDPNNYIGGLLGIDLCQAQNCFWDYEVSGLQDVNGAAAISTATMMQQGTFTGWDFSEEDGDPAAWKMLRPGEDYPRLTWQREFEGDIAGLYGVNWADLTAFTDCWLSAGGECYYVDIDSDGQISFIDFAMLVQDWLEGQ